MVNFEINKPAMLKRKKKKILIFSTIISLILLGIVSIPIIFSISNRLSKTERVKANTLLVEGWLPSYAIEMAFNEFSKNSYDHIITTGIRIDDYFQVSMNGFLIFYAKDKLKEEDNSVDHTISIDAFSQLDGDNSAHFNVFFNDSLVADFFADKKKRHYEIPWKGNLAKIDSIMIQFDNDRSDESGDRNLYVRKIVIDQKIHIPYQYFSEYDIGTLDGKRRVINNFNSHAELARKALISMGLDSSLIVAVSGRKVRINRTLSSALAFREWLQTAKIEIEGINIVTSGTHARRTLLTFNKILDRKYEIGIISLPDYRNDSRKYKILKTLRETFGLVYYWLILIPF